MAIPAWLRGRAVVALAAAWCGVHVVQWVSGAKYSDSFLDDGWQMVPRETLRHDVLGSVWNLHVQPPLYNFVIGMLLRFSPLSDARSTQALILGCSLFATIGLFRLGELFGLSAQVAGVLTIALMADPFMIRYELEPTYEIPMLAMVVWSLILVHHAVSNPTLWRCIAVSCTLTAIVMTRSLFHPLWLLIVLGVMFVVIADVNWRWVLVCAAIPAVVAGGWMLKNEVMFGNGTLSSWFGMNLERSVIAPMDHEAVETLIAEGQLSEIASVPPFTDYDSYVPYVDACEPSHTHPALTEPLRPNGFPDYNYECFVPVYSAMLDASLDAVRARPLDYIASRVDALKFSVDHLEEAGYGHGLLRVVRPIYRVAFLDVRSDIDTTDWQHPLFGPGRVIVYPSLLVVIGWLACCWELLRRSRSIVRRASTPQDVLIALSAFAVIWVLAAGAALEMGENARFRAMVHPLLIMVGVAAALDLWRRRSPAASPLHSEESGGRSGIRTHGDP